MIKQNILTMHPPGNDDNSNIGKIFKKGFNGKGSNSMKKTVLSLLTVILILGILSACGGSHSQAESGELIIAVESSVPEVADAEDSIEDSVGEVVIIEEAEESSAAEDVISEEEGLNSESEEEGLNSEEEKKDKQSNNPFTFTTIEEGKLHMATEPLFPPYTVINDSGELEGIDVEIAEAIAESLGLELEIEEMDFDALLGSVNSGQADIAMAGITVTEERKSSVDFTAAYDTNCQVVIVPEDSDIQNADDLGNGKTIGVSQYSTGEYYCTAFYNEAIVTSFSNITEAMHALITGSIDAVVMEKELAEMLAAPYEALRIFEMEDTDEEYAIAVSKENPALREAISMTLEALIADGTVMNILDKYKLVE